MRTFTPHYGKWEETDYVEPDYHWNQIQFREARFLYDTEEDIQRLTGDRMIPKDWKILE